MPHPTPLAHSAIVQCKDLKQTRWSGRLFQTWSLYEENKFILISNLKEFILIYFKIVIIYLFFVIKISPA